VLGLKLKPIDQLRLAVTVKRAKDKYRANEANSALRDIDDKKDPFGIGRIIAMLARIFVGG
jgi:hypothetical protein